MFALVASTVSLAAVTPDRAVPGREQDARVAHLANRLATAGIARCPVLAPTLGLVLQHLTQFELSHRPALISAFGLKRGPGVAAIVLDGPAARGGLRPGDVLLAIDGVPVPPEPFADAPFDQRNARARADSVIDALTRSSATELTILRGGSEQRLRVTPVPACPSRVHLARSQQTNAYADGVHVFLTTALINDTSEDELAFVIAHEMAHNILGHAAILRGPAVERGLGRTLGRSGAIVRATERAADALGAELMADAGYDPVAGAAFLRRLDEGLRIGLFAAHDSTGDRIAKISATVAARAER